jgi:transcriptional/translational regulatory protein YebC/TACO1
VAWNFETKGVVTVELDDEGRADELSLVAIDAGAEDIKFEDAVLEIYTSPENLPAVQAALSEEGVDLASSDISLVPKTTIGLDGKAAEQTLRLLDNLEELTDVQKAYTNADFPPEVLEQYQDAS